MFRILIESCRIGLQQGGHLINKGTGAAGADSIHALVNAAGKIDDFRIFSAQFDGHISLGSEVLQSSSHGYYFLNKRNM